MFYVSHYPASILPEEGGEPLDRKLRQADGHVKDQALQLVLLAVLGQPGGEREQGDDLGPGDLKQKQKRNHFEN